MSQDVTASFGCATMDGEFQPLDPAELLKAADDAVYVRAGGGSHRSAVVERAKPTEHPDPRTTVEKTSDREVLVTRTFDAPVRLVYAAWTTPALLQRWWVPRSMDMVMLSCEADVRTGGTYRYVFSHGGSAPFAFHGRYLEVVPEARLVWTNEESEPGATTTVTFEPRGETTLLTLRELYPSKEAFEAQHGMEEGMAETFGQLDQLLDALATG